MHFKMLLSAPVLFVPDSKLHFVVYCDLYDWSIGLKRSQDFGYGLQPISFLSHKLASAEQNSITGDREHLAIVLACWKWHHWFAGGAHWSIMCTDHKSLINLAHQKEVSKYQFC